MANTTDDIPSDHHQETTRPTVPGGDTPAGSLGTAPGSKSPVDISYAASIESICGFSLHPANCSSEELDLLSSTNPKEINCDLTCRFCGYNLRGLMTNSRCPECGAAVKDSLNKNLLRYSAQSRIRRLYHGVKLVHASVWWSIISFVVLWVVLGLMALLASNSSITFHPAVEYIIGGIFLLPAFAFPALYPLGWWWVTIPDPIDDQKMRKQRVILRWTAIGFVFVMPLWVSMRSYSPPIVTGSPWLLELVTHALFIIIWFHLFAMNNFMQDVINRCAPQTTDKKFAKHIRVLSRNNKWIRFFPVAILALHWIGMVFHYWVFPMKGLRSAGVSFGSGIGFILISILWLDTIGLLSYLTGTVRIEYLIAFSRIDEPTESNLHNNKQK